MHEQTENNSIPPKEVLDQLAISDSGFVFDPSSGHSFTLNETAMEILKLFKEGHSVQSALESLLNQYEVAPRDLERDVLEFAGSLREYLGSL